MPTNKFMTVTGWDSSVANYNASTGIASSTRFNNMIKGTKAVYEYLNTMIPGYGDSFNLALSVTYSSALVVAIKADSTTGSTGDPSPVDLNDPQTTPGNEVYFNLNGSMYKCTEATSLTLANGTNWFGFSDPHHNARGRNLFVYAIYNTTTNKISLGLAAVPYFRIVGDRNTVNTHPLHMAIPTTSSPASGDRCEVIGIINVSLSSSSWVTSTLPRARIGNQLMSDVMDFDAEILGAGGTYGTWNQGYSYGSYQIHKTMVSFNFAAHLTNAGSFSGIILCPLPTGGPTAAQLNMREIAVGGYHSQPAQNFSGYKGIPVYNNPDGNTNPNYAWLSNYMKLISISGVDSGAAAVAVGDRLKCQGVYPICPIGLHS